MGKLNNSILNGAGNIAGFIGEQISLKVLGGQWNNTYDYDIMVGDKRIDVRKTSCHTTNVVLQRLTSNKNGMFVKQAVFRSIR